MKLTPKEKIKEQVSYLRHIAKNSGLLKRSELNRIADKIELALLEVGASDKTGEQP